MLKGVVNSAIEMTAFDAEVGVLDRRALTLFQTLPLVFPRSNIVGVFIVELVLSSSQSSFPGPTIVGVFIVELVLSSSKSSPKRL
jgi:hypothetical protein